MKIQKIAKYEISLNNNLVRRVVTRLEAHQIAVAERANWPAPAGKVTDMCTGVTLEHPHH